jgi:type I restriction enzyme S subunit
MLDEQMEAVERARAAAEVQFEAVNRFFAEWLRAVFESSEARLWPMKKLGEVLALRKEIVHPRDNPTGPATFVGLEHIESSSGRRIGSLPLEMSLLTGRKPRFYQGDIVYGYLRPYLNKVWIAEFDGLCSVDQYVYSVRPEQADTRFVAWFMRSPTFLNRAPVSRAPAWLPRIRIEEVAATEINLPTLEDQRRVAIMLDEQMATVERMRKGVEEQMNAINELPASFLRRAFSGGSLDE